MHNVSQMGMKPQKGCFHGSVQTVGESKLATCKRKRLAFIGLTTVGD